MILKYEPCCTDTVVGMYSTTGISRIMYLVKFFKEGFQTCIRSKNTMGAQMTTAFLKEQCRPKG